MELDRPHHRTTTSITQSTSSSTSGELFICLTSRLSSSSSMKIAKSILSPGRARDPPISLSTSLSRRLRTNGSIKGGGQASPMFPTGAKKRSNTFENPEPSSPKVTCIGQVRVKTKKKVKQQTRSLSRRRSGGEVSFRKVEQVAAPGNNAAAASSHFEQQECMPHRNQRWVHLPVTICDAVRAFGAEFSCLFPCGSSCFSTNERGVKVEEKANGHGVDSEGGHNSTNNNGQSSCGAVFARWFVALQDCEGGKGRQIELVVGGDEERIEEEVREERISMRSSRRHVFEDIEFKEDVFKGGEEEEEEKARVSICIPPKNALLLMRCRSDPMKMASLANRFWESPAPQDEGKGTPEEEETGEENKELEEELVQEPEIVNEAGIDVEEMDEAVEQFVSAESNEEAEDVEKDANFENEVQESVQEAPEQNFNSNEVLEESGRMLPLVVTEESEPNAHSSEVHVDQEMVENKEENVVQEQVEEQEQEDEGKESTRTDNSLSTAENETEKVLEVEAVDVEAALEEEKQERTDKSTIDEQEEEITQESYLEENEEKQTTTLFISELEATEHVHEQEVHQIEAPDADKDSKEEVVQEENIEEEENKIKEENSSSSSNVLPDCLLLMMCEPKLSMEVSKETWVCSTDFIRWLPERPVKNKKVNVNVSDDQMIKNNKKEVSSCNPTGGVGVGPLPQPQEIINASQQQHQEQQQVMLPARSSCSLPAAAAVSMAAMIEQKFVNAVAYEPFVLTRCKSEPMRTAAAKLMPEACFWKNRKLEPHRNATFGVGAAGVGF